MDSSDYFETNKTMAALLREAEQEIVDAGGPLPVDLRNVPRDRWDEFISFHVTLPAAVGATITEGEAIPPDQLDAYEDAVAKFHGVTEPYYINLSESLRDYGRAWKYVKEAAKFLTGFRLGKDDGK
ncbi:MAG: hypothetical protein WCF18_25910 [Chthoniobacteraceae bacterium]